MQRSPSGLLNCPRVDVDPLRWCHSVGGNVLQHDTCVVRGKRRQRRHINDIRRQIDRGLKMDRGNRDRRRRYWYIPDLGVSQRRHAGNGGNEENENSTHEASYLSVSPTTSVSNAEGGSASSWDPLACAGEW